MTNKELLSFLASSDYPERFRKIMPFIFQWENVVNKQGKILVENDPDDAGGATFCGLDRRSHPNFNFSTATPKSVCDEYLTSYWFKYKCDSYPDKLGEVIFNCCVNAGWGRAAKILAKTRNAAAFLNEQEAFYLRLIKHKPRLAKFKKGWLNRTNALRKFIGVK